MKKFILSKKITILLPSDLKIPFAKNALLDIQKKNDELVITLEHDRGILANIIILPFAAVTMNLVSSKIINNQLVILLKR